MQHSTFSKKFEEFVIAWMEREPISLGIVPPLVVCSLFGLVLLGFVHLLPILF